MIVPTVISSVLYPSVATAHRAMPQRAQNLLRTSSLLTMVIVFPPCLTLVSLANLFLSLWLGAPFAAHAGTVLVILAIGTYFNCIALLPWTFTDAIGRPDIGVMVTMLQMLLFIPVVIALTRRYGIEGASIAWTLRSLFNAVARALACRFLKLDRTSDIYKFLGAGLISGAMLLTCALIGPVPVRIWVTAAGLIIVPLLSIVMTLEWDKIYELHRKAQHYLWSA
jgi:O-antigen/teichoic acid export membrane protein